MSKHTPGPWNAEHDEPCCAELVDAQGHRIRGVNLWLDDACFDANPEMEANHRLIAAAPDLLGAIKGLMALVDSQALVRNVTGDNEPGWAIKALPLVAALKAAQDAIEKAEGTL